MTRAEERVIRAALRLATVYKQRQQNANGGPYPYRVIRWVVDAANALTARRKKGRKG